MKIAVIVPYYTPNKLTEELFDRCTKSVDKRFELICANSNLYGGGVSLSRNIGLEEAFASKVDYVTLLDADDTMTPDAWEQINRAIEEEPGESVIQMNHLRMKEGKTYCKFFNRRGTYYPSNLPLFWFVVWNKVIKTEFLNDIKYKVGLSRGEDELFVLDCIAKSRRIYCSERVAAIHHFDNPESLSRIVTASELIEEQTALLDFLHDHEGDQELGEAVRIRQTELWNCPIYKRLFAGK